MYTVRIDGGLAADIWIDDWTDEDFEAAMRWGRYMRVMHFAYVNPHVAVALTEEGEDEELAWSACQKLRSCGSMHPDFMMFRTDDDRVLIAMRDGVTVLGEKGMWERDSARPWLLRNLGIEACEEGKIRAIVYKDSPDEEYEETFDDEREEDSPEGEEDTEA